MRGSSRCSVQLAGGRNCHSRLELAFGRVFGHYGLKGTVKLATDPRDGPQDLGADACALNHILGANWRPRPQLDNTLVRALWARWTPFLDEGLGSEATELRLGLFNDRGSISLLLPR